MHFPESTVSTVVTMLPSTGNAMHLLHLLAAASREFGPEKEADVLAKLTNTIVRMNDTDSSTEVHEDNFLEDYAGTPNLFHLLAAAAREFGSEMEAEVFAKLVDSLGPMNDNCLLVEMESAAVVDTFEGYH